MRIFTLLLYLSPLLFAYEQGDSLSEDISKKLGIGGDKIYVIDFFASWCGSCKKEMPLISKASDSVDGAKVEFIGVDVDESLQEGHAFQKTLRDGKALTFRVVDDPGSEVIGAFSPIGMPALYIVKNNKVAASFIGAKDHIDELILDKLKVLR